MTGVAFDITPNGLYFSILRAALWKTDSINLPVADTTEWTNITQNLHKQSLLAFASVVLLSSQSKDKLLEHEKENIITHIANLTYTHNHIKRVYASINEVMEKEGLFPILLKGERIAALYPQPNLRACGDIDIYLKPEYIQQGLTILKKLGAEYIDENDHRHELILDGIIIELHHHLIHGTQDRLEIGATDITEEIIMEPIKTNWPPAVILNTGIKVRILPVQSEVFYIFTHLAKHIQREVGLRQFVDLAIVLRSLDGKYNKRSFQKQIKDVGLERLWNLTATILTDYLGLPNEICPPYKKQKGFVLNKLINKILISGNFGQHRKKINFHKDGKLHALKCYIQESSLDIFIAPKKFWSVFKNNIKKFVKRRGFEKNI